MAKLVEKVYGEALFELACENGRAGELLQEAEEVKRILAGSPDFEKLMLNPAIPVEEREKALENVWQNRRFSGQCACFCERSITNSFLPYWIILSCG